MLKNVSNHKLGAPKLQVYKKTHVENVKKENKEPLDENYGLNLLLNLPVIQFDLNDKKEVGLDEEVVLVVENELNNKVSVVDNNQLNKLKLVPSLVKSVQQLYEITEKLEAEIKKLK